MGFFACIGVSGMDRHEGGVRPLPSIDGETAKAPANEADIARHARFEVPVGGCTAHATNERSPLDATHRGTRRRFSFTDASI